jgi:hypothetical protein
MSNYLLPYYFIQNNNIVNEILYNLFSNEITSRTKITSFTSSCKFTQLRYIILFIYEKIINISIVDIYNNRYNNSNNYSILLNDISLIVNKIMSLKNIPDYKIIIGNEIYPEYINNQIIPVENYNIFQNYLQTKYPLNNIYTNVCLCIYKFFESKFYIIHYFTIIIANNNGNLSFYINSAYGSDNVCIPQYTTPININELNSFFNVFNNIDSNRNEFNNIFAKYFGKGGLPQVYSQDQIDENKKLRFSTIAPQQGLQEEISSFSSNVKIGIITNYDDYIINIMKSIPNLYVSKFIKGGKIRKNKNQKFNKTKKAKKSKKIKKSKRCKTNKIR